MRTVGDEAALAFAKKQGKAMGVAVGIVTWSLCDGVLTLFKLILLNYMPADVDKSVLGPLVGVTADGWWIALIISVVVGYLAASEVESNLAPTPGFRGHGVQWLYAFWLPILKGVVAYHVIWMFQKPLGLLF